MTVLFASSETFAPDRLNGPLLGVLELMGELAARGAAPALLCRDPRGVGSAPMRHDARGLPVFTAGDPATVAATLAAALEARAIVLLDAPDGALARAGCASGVPCFAWLVRPIAARSPEAPDPQLQLLAATPGLVAAIAVWYGSAAPLLPLPTPRLDVAPTREHAVFLDPQPAGGVEILFALAAARPDVVFVVAETEPLPAPWRAACFERARRCGNIDWRTGTRDPASLFARARLLVAPQLAPDADPWAIRAAQSIGVPALATAQGCLGEAVGKAGLTVAPDASGAAWLAAFDRLWRDRRAYGRAATAATRQARGPAVGEIAAALIALIETARAADAPAARVA